MDSFQIINTIQNPALGALAIWQFVVGFASRNDRGTPLDYIYTVLPIVANAEMREVICRTNGGLLAYRTKLTKDEKGNVIIGAVSMIPYMHKPTSRALRVALSSNLIERCGETLYFRPKLRNLPTSLMLSEIEKDYKKAAKRLGAQMAQMTREEIFSILGIRF